MTTTNTIVNNLKTMLEEKLSHQLMNMTISDIAKLIDRLDGGKPTRRAKVTRKVPTTRKSKVKGKKKVSRRRRLGPLNKRIAAFIRGASFTDWRSVGDIARRSETRVPDVAMRHAMLKGYKLNGKTYPPVLGWNKVQRAGAKYRLIGG